MTITVNGDAALMRKHGEVRYITEEIAGLRLPPATVLDDAQGTARAA